MVASYTQLLSKRYKGKLDSDADEFIAFAVDGANRMQRLIQDLLAYSRAGTTGKALYEISSEDALEEALTNLRTTIGESGAVVTHDALPAMTTDNSQLAQIFQNLVGNAIKYRSAEVPRVQFRPRKTAAKNGSFPCATMAWESTLNTQRAVTTFGCLKDDSWPSADGETEKES